MERVDGYYLYEMGTKIHPLNDLRAASPNIPGTSYFEAFFKLMIAEGALEPLITRSIFRLRTSVIDGQNLLGAIRALKQKVEAETQEPKTLEHNDIYWIQQYLSKFETVIAAELRLMPLYVATQKGGYDMPALIENGRVCFPIDLSSKAPEAIIDIEQATRCIAFELPTAAGFHLHRANESVLHRYWDAVTGGAPRPTNRNMGDYLKGLNDSNKGDIRVRSALKDLKDLHRNPLIHPEHSIDTTDQAIALMNSIHTVIVYMLKEIPVVAPPPLPGAGGLSVIP